MSAADRPGLAFGIFASVSGTESETLSGGLASYDHARTEAALDRLARSGRPLWIRTYGVHRGRGRVESVTPPDRSKRACACGVPSVSPS